MLATWNEQRGERMIQQRGLIKVRQVTWLLLGLIGSVGWTGCGENPPAAVTRPDRFDGMKLVVGVVGDPSLRRSITAQRGEWTARTGSELNFIETPIDPRAIPNNVDVLVFAGDRLGDLVDAEALAVLPESLVAPPPAPDPATTSADPDAKPVEMVDPLKFREVVPVFRDQVSRYGPDRFGLPIGGSALVVAFHRSAFTDPKHVEAAKAAGIVLRPDELWKNFDKLAEFFHGRDFNDDGQPDYGVALAWGADFEGVGNAVYLARTAASALHPDQYSFLFDSETTEPRVTSPPFVESLQALVALKAFGPPGAGSFDANAARAAFKSGRVALLIDRAEMAATWGTGRFPIGVAPLPGSDRIFDPSRAHWDNLETPSRPSYLPSGGGWLVGITASSKQRPAAEAFVRYLASPETTDRLRAEQDFPMLAVRGPQLTQGLVNPRSCPGVETRPWADSVAKTLNADKVVPGLRVPDASGYLNDLTTARVGAVTGQPVELALQSLAAAWTKRTQALGLSRQTWHHRRSLNGPSTVATPPAR